MIKSSIKPTTNLFDKEHTTWANEILKDKKCPVIIDLRRSLADGLTLVNLLEILTRQRIGEAVSRPVEKEEKLNNLENCVKFLEKQGVDMAGYSSTELADGNLRSSIAFMSRIRSMYDPNYSQKDVSASTNGVGNNLLNHNNQTHVVTVNKQNGHNEHKVGETTKQEIARTDAANFPQDNYIV
ncbi:unnamed protein product [Owenia fusiformis]|uniref:Calponin-homology (CH) domain-containing protein n=1 Tax=Owenia fusiformis TaxID=6347 RepID=A0A8S4PHI6_OWEFU|nr:unnamed protein product [Owenia fusiformis]